MRKLRIRGDSIEIEVSPEELAVINNALNEAREFVPDSEFHARMGVKVDVVERLLEDVQRALDPAQHHD